MAQNRFSQQLANTSQAGVYPSRVTRTQRRIQQDEARKKNKSYTELRKQAEQIQQNKFSKVKSVQEYETEYNRLSPELKQFFSSPQEVQQTQSSKLQNAKTQTEQRIQFADQKISDVNSNYREELQNLQNKKGEARTSKERDRYRDAIEERKEEYKEDIGYWNNYKSGLEDGLNKLSRGDNLSYNQIEDYADEKGEVGKTKQISKVQQKNLREKEQIRIDKAIKDIQQRGGRYERITENKKGEVTSQKFYGIVDGKYTLLGEQKATDLSKIARPSEIEQAEVTQTYSVAGQRLAFTSPEKLYVAKDSGELVTPFGSLGKSEAETVAERERALQEYKEEKVTKAKQFIDENEFLSMIDKTLTDKKITVVDNGVDLSKTLYGTTPLGTSIKMPDEFLKERKPIKFSLDGLSPISIYTLPPEIAKAGVEAERQKNEEADRQIKAIEELDRITDLAPEDIQYEVQAEGIERLKTIGLKTELDEKTGTINFKSPQLEVSKSFNLYELDKADRKKSRFIYNFSRVIPESTKELSLPYQTRGTGTFDPNTGDFKAEKSSITLPQRVEKFSFNPYKFAVGTRIALTKGAEFYLVGKGIGVVLGGASKLVAGTSSLARGIYSSLGGGYNIASATVKGAKVSAQLTPTLGNRILSTSFARSTLKGTGSVLKTTGTGTLFIGATGLYAYGKVKQRKYYSATYGDLGKEVFKYETIGEIGGLATLYGEGIYKRSQIKKLNKKISQENYLKQQKSERLKNIRDYGQFSQRAEVSYRAIGQGKQLSDKEIKELANLYSQSTGITKQKAITTLRESAYYKQTLKVATADKAFVTNKYALASRTSTGKSSKEVAFEFTKRGTRLSNINIKTTTGKGKYALTSVFEKARFSPNNPENVLVLKKTVISKILAKKITVDVNSGRRIDYLVQNRILKTSPYGNSKFTLSEAGKLGLAKVNQKQLAKIYLKAGVGANTSPLPTVNVRIEAPAFKDTNLGFKVAKEGEYFFTQGGVSGRTKPLKNILRNIKFGEVNKPLVIKNNPPDELRSLVLKNLKANKPITKDNILREITLKNILKGNIKATPAKSIPRATGGAYAGTGLYERTAQTSVNALNYGTPSAIRSFNVKDVSVSPSVFGDFKINTKTNLLSGLGLGTSPLIKVAVLEALSGRLNSRTRNQLKIQLKERQIQTEAPAQRNREDLVPRQPTPQRSGSVSTNFLLGGDINIKVTTPKINDPSPPRINYIPPIKTQRDFIKVRSRKVKGQKSIEEQILLPDFTTRILGLSPQRVSSVKDALKEINKVQTGLNIRRGIVIR